VREVQVDGDDRRGIGGLGQDFVGLPDLLEQRPRAHSLQPLPMYTVALANANIAALFGLRV
jgi:hypothetical protein